MLQKLKNGYKMPLAVIAIAVMIGGGLFAIPNASFEAESGNLSNASNITDVLASGGRAIAFNGLVVDPEPSVTCHLNATTANFAAQVTAATAGQTICLAAGSYGTWAGTNKAITITKQAGASPSMYIEFNTGDSGFTIDGLQLTGGAILGSARNITIKNSAFSGSLVIDGPSESNILLDSNTHININFAGANNQVTCGASPAAIHLPYGLSAGKTSGVTIQNSLFRGGHKDGVQTGVGVNIINNEFDDISEHGAVCRDYPGDSPHTDPIQLLGADGSVVRGNYIHHSADGIVAYDGVSNTIIEDNVVDVVNGRYGIELYADVNSIIRNNTVIRRTSCAYNGLCGHIVLDRKTADSAGRGTIVENNIAHTISINNGSTAAVNRNNMLATSASGQNFSGAPSFQGGASPNSFIGYLLAAGSPGIGRATDGGNVGVRQ